MGFYNLFCQYYTKTKDNCFHSHFFNSLHAYYLKTSPTLTCTAPDAPGVFLRCHAS